MVDGSKFFEMQAHVLKNGSVFVHLVADKCDILLLDQMTSRVIRHGGTLKTQSRETLDEISPYLAKRMVGQFNLPLQQTIKEAFDPQDVLCSNRIFHVRKENEKSLYERAKEKNKQVNYIATVISGGKKQ